MRQDESPQPFLVGFPGEELGEEPRLMLDPHFFSGLDGVGEFLGQLAQHYARSFVQSGRAMDIVDALEQVSEAFALEMTEALQRASEDED